ncbi:hypothetical protein [Pseudodesulfovibrio portus]|uniref:Uncharacterized protein n=1 Tax=Pseudodesulfovibrio portus TaxID=231439 RepID=A0ABN6RP88_9BACT|nr:hypothetical protein [Pseudodesulfovibrio portus]BDQ32621.1 hypothetical protein JCM14722_01630 [Pseudodesulfovibrio portus]
MSGIKDFADQLQQDVVSDMAESYFGARKNLEDMINAFDQMVTEFRFMAAKLSKAAAALHKLLLDTDTARNFYIALDILPSCIPFSDNDASEFEPGPVPFAFTGRGRYIKCVVRAYDRFQKVSDEYLNGRYFDDPEHPGRKRLTIHYLRLRAMSQYINDQIHKVNDQISPTGMLRYVKRMNPDVTERERIMGNMCLFEGGELDKDMCFSPMDFSDLKLPVVQDLPPLRKVRDAIRTFCDELYSVRKQDVDPLVADMRKAASGPQ